MRRRPFIVSGIWLLCSGGVELSAAVGAEEVTGVSEVEFGEPEGVEAVVGFKILESVGVDEAVAGCPSPASRSILSGGIGLVWSLGRVVISQHAIQYFLTA